MENGQTFRVGLTSCGTQKTNKKTNKKTQSFRHLKKEEDEEEGDKLQVSK